MKYRRTGILMAVVLALSLAGCGGGNSGGVSASSIAAATTSCLAGAPAEGVDVTARYQDQLLGAYGGEHDMAYRFSENGVLNVADWNSETSALAEGSWWVWKEGEKVYLCTSLQGTAAQYTFAVSEEGVLSLYDAATGELSDRLTPYTCGVFP